MLRKTGFDGGSHKKHRPHIKVGKDAEDEEEDYEPCVTKSFEHAKYFGQAWKITITGSEHEHDWTSIDQVLTM